MSRPLARQQPESARSDRLERAGRDRRPAGIAQAAAGEDHRARAALGQRAAAGDVVGHGRRAAGVVEQQGAVIGDVARAERAAAGELQRAGAMVVGPV